MCEGEAQLIKHTEDVPAEGLRLEPVLIVQVHPSADQSGPRPWSGWLLLERSEKHFDKQHSSSKAAV